MKNYEIIGNGFEIILKPLVVYVANSMQDIYMSGWWHRGVLHKLTKEGKKGLPQSASFDIYVESLDRTRTLMIFDRNWHDVFTYKLPIDHRSYAKELIGVRNAVAHHGIKDCDACYAWRALDTMARLMQGIDDNASQEVRNLIEQYYCNPYFLYEDYVESQT